MLERVADMLDVLGENPFRVRSYRNAARTIEEMAEPVASWEVSGRDLKEMPGIGKSMAEKVHELLSTGRLAVFEELCEKVPPGVIDMLRLQGLGPRKVKLLYDDLKIDSIDALDEAARSGKLQSLPGMGARTEEKLVRAIEQYREGAGRFMLSEGLEYSDRLVALLGAVKGVQQCESAGSLRRRRETVGDLDILAAAASGPEVMDEFVRLPGVTEVIARGSTKSSVRLDCGLQVDLRVVEPRSFGAALHYFTGSKEHNVAIRERAHKRGLKVSEYGIFRARGGKRIGGKDEEDVFESVGLASIPPELRECRGEIAAAEAGILPDLVTGEDIRGDLHVHTTATDGKDTIAAMAAGALALGYEYIAVTDHSKAVRIAGGLDEKQFSRHLKAIEKAQAKVPGIRILKGVEVDILSDGGLDLDDEVLKECDVVVASVHSRFGMTEREMTGRITSAIRHRHVHILGHPTGRLIFEREPYRVDMEEVIRAAAGEGVAMEINAHPDRLDLRDVDARMARDMGARVAISTDAHSVRDLGLMRYGVFTARRGWVEAGDVINTLPVSRLLKALRGN